MSQNPSHDILQHPEFQKMAHKKAVLGWSFSALMLIVYILFILALGFTPELLSVPISPNHVITWGILFGFALIVFAFIITAIYIYKANGTYERMTQKVIDDIQRGKL